MSQVRFVGRAVGAAALLAVVFQFPITGQDPDHGGGGGCIDVTGGSSALPCHGVAPAPAAQSAGQPLTGSSAQAIVPRKRELR